MFHKFHQTNSSLVHNEIAPIHTAIACHSHLRALGLPGQAPNAHAVHVQGRHLITTGLQRHEEIVSGFVLRGSVIWADGAWQMAAVLVMSSWQFPCEPFGTFSR